MKVKIYNPRILLSLVFLVSLAFAACSGGSANPFAGEAKKVDKNIQNLMQLAVGMTKNQVFDLCGVAYQIEGYDWGSVWFYQYRKGNSQSFISKQDLLKFCTPIVFDNTDRVLGYGEKVYTSTLEDLGDGGQF